MPQGDEDAGVVEEALKESKEAVVADLDAAEVLQPSVGAFDFPALAVAAELSFIFKSAMAVVAAVGDDQLGATLFHSLAQWVGSHSHGQQSRRKRERGRPRPVRGTFTVATVTCTSHHP